MLSFSRQRASSFLKASPHESTTSGASRYNLQQFRTVRAKRANNNHFSDSIRRDERLLKRLEAQLATVQMKIKREEEEAADLMRTQAHRGAQQDESSNLTVENHNYYFWGKVLTEEDRRQLSSYDIRSLDDLYSVYQMAETALLQTPYHTIEDLAPRLQFAYEMYKSIPAKLSEAGRVQAKSPFGGWF